MSIPWVVLAREVSPALGSRAVSVGGGTAMWGGKKTKDSGPSLFLTWAPKCYLFYGVVSVHEKEPGMRSKQHNSHKSLLLMHPALSWWSLSSMPFTCFWFFSLYLLQVKQKPRMPQPGSMLLLSLSLAGSLCSIVTKPKCLEMVFGVTLLLHCEVWQDGKWDIFIGILAESSKVCPAEGYTGRA